MGHRVTEVTTLPSDGEDYDREDQLGESSSKGDGFTLVEILIVILILGVLAGVAVFSVSDMDTASATSGCQANYKTVETALEAYKVQESAYPTAGVTFGVAAGTTNAAAALMLQDTSKGPTAGPWLLDAPYSAGDYQIVVSTSGDGAISVYTAPGPTPVSDTGINGGSLVGVGMASCRLVS